MPTLSSTGAAAAAGLGLFLALAACSSDTTSAPPTTSDAATTVPDAGGGDTGAAAETGASDAGKKKFGEACTSAAECESNECFLGGSQSFCTLKCTMATAAKDCPSPPTSGQCNNQGYCKK